MKLSKSTQILFHLATLFAVPPAHAQLTWDANGTGAGQTNGGANWLGSNLWWNGTTNQNWVSSSNAIFGGAEGDWISAITEVSALGELFPGIGSAGTSRVSFAGDQRSLLKSAETLPIAISGAILEIIS